MLDFEMSNEEKVPNTPGGVEGWAEMGVEWGWG